MFKPVHIDKMIHFTYHTIIKASLDSPSTFPRYVYHLTPLHQIESYIQKNEYFLGKFITSKLFTNYFLSDVILTCFMSFSNINTSVTII